MRGLQGSQETDFDIVLCKVGKNLPPGWSFPVGKGSAGTSQAPESQSHLASDLPENLKDETPPESPRWVCFLIPKKWGQVGQMRFPAQLPELPWDLPQNLPPISSPLCPQPGSASPYSSSITHRGRLQDITPANHFPPCQCTFRLQAENWLTQDSLQWFTPSDFIHKFPLEAALFHI